MVNLTTLRETCVDDVCILNTGDHVSITHATTVAYSRALPAPANLLIEQIDSRMFSVLESLSEAVLARIIDGAKKSPEISQRYKDMLP